jgi:Mn2+/Fe2+ NRAMP family transporter
LIAKVKGSKLWRNLLIFLVILGPGIITGSVDNDVGGITTYSDAGARYGYKLLWILIPSFIVLFVVQEMNARMGHPNWGAAGSAIIKPKMEYDFVYISTVIGIIGTTIAPWMQFYMQSAVIEKGIKLKDYKYTIIDVVVGCTATVVVAFFIMIACASTLFVNGHGTEITDASVAAVALKPFAGAFASQMFAFGLFIASIFSATILPVATAFYVCEAFGFEAGIDKKWKEAPQFYWLYTGIIVFGAGIILIPKAPLIQISLWSQRINGILLPVVLICMMLIINKKDVMGKYVNKRFGNIVGWITIVILVALSLTLFISKLL